MHCPSLLTISTGSEIGGIKVILISDWEKKLPNSFTRKYGGGISNPVFLKLPDGFEWKVYWTKHDGEILLEKGWNEFATYYSLDHGHLVLFEYKESAHFEVHIFDMSGLEIEYPFHGQISDETVEILDEMPLTPSQNTRLKKSPMFSSPQPCKKLRTETSGDATTSHNLRNMPQLHQINGNQSQEKSTFASVKQELDEEIGGVNQSPNVEQSTIVTEALNRGRIYRSRNNPSFMVVMRPSYVNGYSMNVPLMFAENYLKEKQGASLLQVQDGRTWSVIYNQGKLNAGWNRFASDNDLNVGDICVFELTDRKGLYFKVSISRAIQEPSCTLTQETAQGDGINWSDPGRVQYVDVDIMAEITSKGRKATQRTSMMFSPAFDTNGAKKEAEKFTSENPFFIVSIKPSYQGTDRPHVSAVFVRKYLKNEKQILTLQFGNKLWRVKLLCYSYRTPCKMSNGWVLFAKENELKGGDVCVFELININGEGAVFDVHIFRRHY